MRHLMLGLALLGLAATAALASPGDQRPGHRAEKPASVELGVRPFFLVADLPGILADGNNGFYYQTVDTAPTSEGEMLRVLDVLAKDVGVMGVFSGWPATTTFYAYCAGLR